MRGKELYLLETLPYGDVVFSIEATFSHINSGELLLEVTATMTSSIHLA